MAIVGFILCKDCKESLLQLLLRINNYLIIESARGYGELSDERSFQGGVFLSLF